MQAECEDKEHLSAMAILNSGESLGKVSEPTRHRPDIMLAAVELRVTNLAFVTDDFKSDPASMLAAVKADPVAVEYANIKLFSDKTWIRGVLEMHPKLFERAKGDVLEDHDIAIFACTKHGLNLQYVSAELRDNREVVLAAVQAHGTALAFASAERKNDREIVIAALKDNRMAFAHASSALRDDEVIKGLCTSQLDQGDVLEEVAARGTARRIKEIFRQADKDGDGTIDTCDLERLLKKLDSANWTHMRAYRLLQCMDTNKDGYVSFEEFVDWIHKGCDLDPRFENAVEKWKEQGETETIG